MPIRVTMGGEKGLRKSPVWPAPWKMIAKVEGVMPTAATSGMTSNQANRADHRSENGAFLGLDTDFAHQNVDDGGGDTGLTQNQTEARAKHDDKADESQE